MHITIIWLLYGSFSQGISGRGIRLFDHLQNVNPYLTQTKPHNNVTPLPLKRRDITGRPDTRADLSTSKRFHFLGIPGRVFFKFDIMDGESLETKLFFIFFCR